MARIMGVDEAGKPFEPNRKKAGRENKKNGGRVSDVRQTPNSLTTPSEKIVGNTKGVKDKERKTFFSKAVEKAISLTANSNSDDNISITEWQESYRDSEKAGTTEEGVVEQERSPRIFLHQEMIEDFAALAKDLPDIKVERVDTKEGEVYLKYMYNDTTITYLLKSGVEILYSVIIHVLGRSYYIYGDCSLWEIIINERKVEELLIDPNVDIDEYGEDPLLSRNDDPLFKPQVDTKEDLIVMEITDPDVGYVITEYFIWRIKAMAVIQL